MSAKFSHYFGEKVPISQQELAKHLKDERRGLQILSELQSVMSGRIGWDNIARKIGGISHHTIEDHVSIFEGTFLGKILYQFDFHKRHFSYRKTKKFYFMDNLIYFIIRVCMKNGITFFRITLI